MAENSMKPRIRFKGYTDAWEQRKLGEVGETYAGLSGKSKEDFGHGDAVFVPYMNVFANPIADTEMIESIEIDDRQAKVKEGDVFFTTSSETPEEVGMSSVWLKNGENVYLNSFCFGFRPSESMNLYYLAYMLRSNGVRKKIIFLAQGISRYNISKKKMMEIKIPLPLDTEQQQLGDIFKQLDNLITLHQRKYDKFVNIKKALLEKMFPQGDETTPKIRFKGFTDAWEQRKLGNTIDFYSGLTYSPSDVVKDNGVFVLRSSNVREGEIVEEDNVYVRAGAVNSDNVNIGDIIVVVRNGSRSLIGKHAKIKKNMPQTVIGAFMTGLRYENSSYLNAVLNTSIFEKEIEKDLGATINQITTGAFKKMVFPFPKQHEQLQIGDFFEQIDNLITLHQRQLEKLKNIKSALLEKMFV